MEPSIFGPFLRELRTRQELTQPQLAEKLHVSAAAVSKWERGKCLPDLSKLEDLAEILDVSIMELMQCRLEERELPRMELAVVYSETLSEAKKQTTRKARRWLLLAGCLAAVLVLGYYFPLHHIAQVWWPSYYDTGEISMLAYIGSTEDRQTAQKIMNLAELAFSDLSLTREEAEEKYGLLVRYTNPAERGVVQEEHSLELWSARFYGSEGYMWVYYSQEGYNSAGERFTGSWRIPSLWRLEKDESGEWYVQSIKEHP